MKEILLIIFMLISVIIYWKVFSSINNYDFPKGQRILISIVTVLFPIIGLIFFEIAKKRTT
jgi:hypothetical protein